LPAAVMGDHYCDMRGRSNAEQGFRDLVVWLAECFSFDVPDYNLESSKGIAVPSVQIIHVHGHNEGQIFAIGGSVSGEINAASGDIHKQEPPAEKLKPAPPTNKVTL